MLHSVTSTTHTSFEELKTIIHLDAFPKKDDWIYAYSYVTTK